MKKIISLIMSVAIFAALTLPCFAADGNNVITVIDEIVNRPYVDVTRTRAVSGSNNSEEPKQETYGSLLNSSQLNTCRPILNVYEQQAYDRIVALSISDMNVGTSDTSHKFTINFPSPVTMDEYTAAFDTLHLRDALSYDFPEIFFLQIRKGYAYNQSTGKVLAIVIYPTIVDDYTSAVNPSLGDVSSLYNQMMNVVHTTSFSNCNNRYDLVKAIHDYLCNSIVYTDASATDWVENEYNPVQSPLGALVFKKAVCQGYAEAFKLFCDYYKIPCVTVVGIGASSTVSGGHMWNAVKMDDGKWYL